METLRGQAPSSHFAVLPFGDRGRMSPTLPLKAEVRRPHLCTHNSDVSGTIQVGKAEHCGEMPKRVP